MKISKRTLRQINNTRDIYDYDLENMICTVTLNYDTPEDMIDPHLSTPSTPCISEDFSEYFCQIISEVPKDFTVDYEIKIKDYQNYDHNKMQKALKTNIENTFYYYDEERKKYNVLSIIFIIIGIIALAINVIGDGMDWFGPKGEVGTEIIESIFDIISWVFIWEGGAILFLTYENSSTQFRKEIRRLNGVSFIDTKGKILDRLNADYFYESGVKLSTREHFARNFILFSNALLLSLLCIGLVEFIAKISTFTTTQIIFLSFFYILGLLLAISNIQFYREKGLLQKFALPIGAILFSCSLTENIIQWASYDFTDIKKTILNAALLITILINILCLLFMKKQSIKIDK